VNAPREDTRVSDAASPAAAGLRFHWPVDVRFHDLDAMGHAHHSLVLVYIEEARAAYWRDVADRRDVADIDYVIAEVTIRFLHRIFFPGRLDIGVRVSRLGRSSFDMEYEVRDTGGELLATATTRQVMYDYATATSMAMPEEVRARISAFEGI
jgi:acyl-CoA thioester hydrolase